MNLFGESLERVLKRLSVDKGDPLMPKSLYEKVKWEKKASCSIYCREIDHLFGNQYIRLENDGWQSPPTSQELISLLAASYKSMLDPDYKALAENVCEQQFEFTNAMMQREDDPDNGKYNLHIYEDVNALEFDGARYLKPAGDEWYDKKFTFDIASLNLSLVDMKMLYDITPNLFQYFFRRSYDQVPAEMVIMGSKCGFEVPKNQELHPICVGFGEYDDLNVEGFQIAGRRYAACRGVRDE